eukprot:sb/3476024/
MKERDARRFNIFKLSVRLITGKVTREVRTDRHKETTNQNSSFRSRDCLTAKQRLVLPESVGSGLFPNYNFTWTKAGNEYNMMDLSPRFTGIRAISHVQQTPFVYRHLSQGEGKGDGYCTVH